MVFKKYLLVAFILASGQFSNLANAQESEPAYIKQWCHNVELVLRNTQRAAMQATTYSSEKIILVHGILEAIEMSRPKQEMFLKLTLHNSLEDLKIFEGDVPRQVEFLRLSIRNALEDLDFIDMTLDNKSDKGPYISEILGRSLIEGQRLPDNTQELAFHVATMMRAIGLIDVSDYRRTGAYACARKILSAGLNDGQNPELDEVSKVLVLRQAIHQGRRSLSGGGCRHD